MNFKRFVLTLVLVFLALAVGWWGRGLMSAHSGMQHGEAESSTGGACPDGSAPLYWKAPMDPTYVREAPGKSPMGMDLVPECAAAGGAASEGRVKIDSATIQNMGV